MKYLIQNFKIGPRENLELCIEKRFNLTKFSYKILQKSIDARSKENILLVFKLCVETNDFIKGNNVSVYEEKKVDIIYPKWNKLSPVIVGFGPAGMFAALYLARCNARPIIIERGSKIEDRKKEVQDFLKHKVLCENSNVQFGEGGAGAFSDGKLVTNVKDPLIQFILEEFYKHGALEDVLYESKPHIGTDYLEIVVKNIRLEIEKLGGTFYFNHKFSHAESQNKTVKVFVDGIEPIQTQNLILALGHSAKDTIRNLHNVMKLKMEQKSFSMGVRVEHPKEWMDKAQYGEMHTYLPSAYYKLACHHNNRGIYTFCMCPGGYVLASTSDEESIVTNGMSNHSRDNINSNSAILVDVNPKDYDRGSVLDGIAYQERFERLAYRIANDYRAPANLMKEFLENKVATNLRSVETTYPHGLILCDLKKCLPRFVVEELKYGITQFDKRLKGFNFPDAILIGIESRSSSPVRIIRNEQRESSMKGIYPVGEGAGYAGGITSAALDGLKTAILIAGE